MKIELNHTIVPAHDKEQSARFYEKLFGFKYEGPLGHFAPVRIESQSLSLDFDNREEFRPGHYAFLVSDAEFDAAFARIRAQGLRYYADPRRTKPDEINHLHGGRGVYWTDPNGHYLEIITRPYGSGG